MKLQLLVHGLEILLKQPRTCIFQLKVHFQSIIERTY